MIHSTVISDPGGRGIKVGTGTRVWHFVHLSQGVWIGANTVIGDYVYIGPDVTIGDHCKIQAHASINEGVTIKDDVFVGPGVTFTNVRRPLANRSGGPPAEFLKTLVKHGASIGAGAIILCGITIGEGAFIGAGSVVLTDVPDGIDVFGNPARRIK